MKKVGLLGGTFDPPHLGHLMMAEEARLKTELDEIWWMPNRIPPHKQLSSNTTENQRVTLVSKMVDLHPSYKLSKVEMERSGPSYTVDTIKKLQNDHPDVQFSFIMGGDSLKHFSMWDRSDELQKMLPFIVLIRPGFAIPEATKFLDLTILDEISLELSSSYIREKVKNNSLNQFLLIKEVYEYIRENRLYE
ncbi:nicotinate (nicotinamide) nucleotide adenylyltransferase [Salipaludibacillus keqinensis]|uniref:Probable nicotinate-nucleotide adenylyltransferase n=1 Tax=Salipaludibacillus keqinensis TaxID=2045207 RepID=A0A323TI59_9BACI|nr:nicotinate-nucleotide adenylyltransferase [Salipaludibacillus keqinensis]PYZ94220.1 nicotinate (nicotinamide) nucleotide adenylyltransferase [Salipaludibacillus keqinensis]